MNALFAIPNTGLRRDVSYNAVATTSALDIPAVPDITATPIGPPGQIFFDVKTQELFYSTGSDWNRIDASSVFSTDQPDYIVVGAGASGCACARGLSNPIGGEYKNSVMLLESSDVSSYYTFDVNDATTSSQNTLIYNPKFAELSTSLNHQTYSSANVAGGRTSHLPMQWVRGTPEAFDAWATLLSDSAWSYQSLLPIILSYERYTPDATIPDLTQRGSVASGLLCCSQSPPLTDAFSTAISTGLSIPLIPDYNSHPFVAGSYQNLVGVSAEQLYNTPGIPTQRADAYGAFIVGVTTPGVTIPGVLNTVTLNGLAGRKLSVRFGAEVTRVLFSGNKAIGVELLVSNSTSTTSQVLFANKGVVVCAGSISSPTVLQRSAIGPVLTLGAAGIIPLIANNNVGNGLMCQYGPAALIEKLTPSSPPSSTLNCAFGDLGLLPIERRVQVNYTYPGTSQLSTLSPSIVSALNLGSFDSVSLQGYLMSPSSRGSVSILSPSLIPPLVDFGLYSDGSYNVPGTDAANVIAYLKQLQLISAAEGGNPSNVLFPPNSHYPAPYGPAPSDALLFESASTTTSIKPGSCCGTCRMGVDILHGVVDTNLLVFGTTGLYVADASVVPVIPTGDISFASILIGLRMAQILGGNI
jgi:choline dehydrogenase